MKPRLLRKNSRQDKLRQFNRPAIYWLGKLGPFKPADLDIPLPGSHSHFSGYGTLGSIQQLYKYALKCLQADILFIQSNNNVCDYDPE